MLCFVVLCFAEFRFLLFCFILKGKTQHNKTKHCFCFVYCVLSVAEFRVTSVVSWILDPRSWILSTDPEYTCTTLAKKGGEYDMPVGNALFVTGTDQRRS